jgi:hypothetical protein
VLSPCCLSVHPPVCPSLSVQLSVYPLILLFWSYEAYEITLLSVSIYPQNLVRRLKGSACCVPLNFFISYAVRAVTKERRRLVLPFLLYVRIFRCLWRK